MYNTDVFLMDLFYNAKFHGTVLCHCVLVISKLEIGVGMSLVRIHGHVMGLWNHVMREALILISPQSAYG